MTYKIEKDDDDNEALSMNAVIHDNTVELDWVSEEDDAETYAQRILARAKTIAHVESSSVVPQSALLAMRLYRRGDVFVSGMACADEYREQATRLAKEAALGMYDSAFPDVAAKAQAFVEENITDLQRLAAINLDPILEAGAGKQLAPDQFLPHLLDQAKSELEEAGEVVQRIGWLVHNRMALVPGAQPFEKYRYFRAVSEVARKANADAVVLVMDGYQLGPDGERTGEEILAATWINPDGTCAIVGAGYKRRKHPQLRNDIITFSPNIAPLGKANQNLVPAWGMYQQN